MDKEYTLSAQNIFYEWPKQVLLEDIGFSITRGQILNVCGANGCGKSTLLRIIAGLLQPHAGEIHWGEGINQDMLYIGHQTGLKTGLTALENLHLDCLLSQQNARISAAAALQHLGVYAVKHVAVEQLSAGQAKRVALARLLLLQALVWIIDEPYTNLDQKAVSIINELMMQHLQQGGLVVIATHSNADYFANRVDVIQVALQ